MASEIDQMGIVSRKTGDFPRPRQGQGGGWSCDTRATPANGRAEPGRQTIDICVQNGRQKRHPPYYIPLHPTSRNHRPHSPRTLSHGLSTSLSRMPPKLFNFRTQPLTANQAILLSLTLFVLPLFRPLHRPSVPLSDPPCPPLGPLVLLICVCTRLHVILPFSLFLFISLSIVVLCFLCLPLARSLSSKNNTPKPRNSSAR